MKDLYCECCGGGLEIFQGVPVVCEFCSDGNCRCSQVSDDDDDGYYDDDSYYERHAMGFTALD